MTRRKPNRTQAEFLQLARHEAAHALAVEFMGGRVACVKILKRRNRYGADAYCLSDRRAKPTAFASGHIIMAGDASDQLYGYRKVGTYSWGDFRHIKRTRLKADDVALLTGMLRCWLSTPEIKRLHNAVARALVKKDLSGAEIRRIIRKESKKS